MPIACVVFPRCTLVAFFTSISVKGVQHRVALLKFLREAHEEVGNLDKKEGKTGKIAKKLTERRAVPNNTRHLIPCLPQRHYSELILDVRAFTQCYA